MGADYIEAKTEKGKMCSFDLEIDISGMDHYNTLYAITNPCGKGYLSVKYFPVKTRSILLINDLHHSSNTYSAVTHSDNNNAVEQINSHSNKTNSFIEIDSKKYGDMFKRASFNYETNCLTLQDDISNTVIKEIKFENNTFAMNISKSQSGYAVQVLNADKPVEVVADDVVKSYDFPDNIMHRYLYIYDSSLNLTKEIPLDNAIPKDAFDLRSSIDISDDGSKALIAYGESLYICNLASGKIDKLFDKTNNHVDFKRAQFTDDGKYIVFIGNSTEFDEKSSVYGLIDIAEKKMSMHEAKEFHASNIMLSGKYACFCDLEFLLDYKNGKIPILNIETDESSIIQLDGTESTFAKVTEDGKYLITRKKIDGDIRVRLYDIKTQKVVKEKLFDYNESIYEILDVIYSGDSSLYYLVCMFEDKLAFYPFDCEV